MDAAETVLAAERLLLVPGRLFDLAALDAGQLALGDDARFRILDPDQLRGAPAAERALRIFGGEVDPILRTAVAADDGASHAGAVLAANLARFGHLAPS